jgi:predicted transcriptional regulator of viral defense system
VGDWSGPLAAYTASPTFLRIDSLNTGEAVLWAKADDGPQNIALSHATALAVYGVSDANPAFVHITIPRNARLRRVRPKWVEIHHADLQVPT